MKPNKRLIRIGKIKKEKRKRRDFPIFTAPPVPQTRKVVINTCYGGFGLSHKAIMEYYKRKGITAYPFIDKRVDGHCDFKHFIPYTNQKHSFLIHYSSKPLNEDGTYDQTTYLAQGRELQRDDPDIIDIIEKMGKKSWGQHAELTIVEIPMDVSWEIEEYDGTEWVAETHRTWK
jgi:hypothetical protein